MKNLSGRLCAGVAFATLSLGLALSGAAQATTMTQQFKGPAISLNGPQSINAQVSNVITIVLPSGAIFDYGYASATVIVNDTDIFYNFDGSGGSYNSGSYASMMVMATLTSPATISYALTAGIPMASGDYGDIVNAQATVTYDLPTPPPTPAPEPATWALILVGAGGVGAAMRAKNRRSLSAL